MLSVLGRERLGAHEGSTHQDVSSPGGSDLRASYHPGPERAERRLEGPRGGEGKSALRPPSTRSGRNLAELLSFEEPLAAERGVEPPGREPEGAQEHHGSGPDVPGVEARRNGDTEQPIHGEDP